jgi:plastocyanin
MASSRTIVIVAVVAVILLIVVVGASMLNTGGTNNPATTGNEVEIRSSGYTFVFNPSSLTVHVGDNVTWVNHGGTDHTVVSDNATDPFNSGIIANGQSYTRQFNQIGEFPYHCSIHTYMIGTITVIA